VYLALDSIGPANRWTIHLVRLATACAAGGAAYALFALVMKVPEARWLVQRHKAPPA